MPTADISTARIAAHLNRLVLEGADEPGAVRRVQYAADQMAVANLQPVLWESFLVPFGDAVPLAPGEAGTSSRFHVIGYLAGRNPNVYSELVLLSADLDSPGAAAVLEAVRALEAEALRGLVPEATVGVALWGPPRGGVAAVRDFLNRPPWSTDAISVVLHVTADTTDVAPVRRAWEAAGVPFEVISTGEGAMPARAEAPLTAVAYRLAHGAYAAARVAASESFLEASRRTSLPSE